jgi:hypothetical protein
MLQNQLIPVILSHKITPNIGQRRKTRGHAKGENGSAVYSKYRLGFHEIRVSITPMITVIIKLITLIVVLRLSSPSNPW